MDSWLNFTRPPYVPKSKNGIFRNIPKNRDIPFFGNFGMSHVFFLEYSKISYIPDFRKLVCPKIENGISQYSKLFQKNVVGYVPNIFWDIPYSKLARHVYVPDLKWNIPEYSWINPIYYASSQFFSWLCYVCSINSSSKRDLKPLASSLLATLSLVSALNSVVLF